MAGPQGTRRLARVSETIREELARLLLKAVNDPQLSWVTITEVDTSPDLRTARVFFVATGVKDQQSVHKSLTKAAPFIQRELGQVLKLRRTPKLTFHHDDSFDKGERIDRLIGEIESENETRRKGESPAAALDRLVDEAGLILLATHRNPDGDAVGSLLGMSAILENLQKQHIVLCPDGIPEVLGFLPGADRVVAELDPQDSVDLTLLVDTADGNLLPDGFPEPDKRGTLVVIDHHLRHDDLGDLVIRHESSSVGEMLFDLARELVWPVDEKVAECLYTSIVADTGSFRYSSASPETHRVAAELIAAGAQPWRVATALYESYPLARQRLLGEVISTLELSDDGRLAVLHSTPEMLARAGAKKADLDGMVNLGRAVAGVEISAMFRVEPQGDIKVSFRSRGRIDVSLLATRFGGGGHFNAAGCTIKGLELTAAKKKVIAAAEETLARGVPADGR